MHPLRGGSDWYYEQVASGREDYYAEAQTGDDASGRWVGRGARRLGLGGVLAPGDLARMGEGRDPASLVTHFSQAVPASGGGGRVGVWEEGRFRRSP